MKQEDKELLLKDLCARLPYGVKIALKNSEAYHHDNIAKIGDTTIDKLKSFDGKYFRINHDNPLDWSWYVSEISIEDIKPYLFPLSSMTEEQIEEAKTYFWKDVDYSKNLADKGINCFYPCFNILEFYHKYHLDYRGLIEKGLAIDATGLNIY